MHNLQASEAAGKLRAILAWHGKTYEAQIPVPSSGSLRMRSVLESKDLPC